MNCLTKHCFFYIHLHLIFHLYDTSNKKNYCILCIIILWQMHIVELACLSLFYTYFYIFFRVKNIFWQILTSSSIITEPDFTSVIHEWNLSMTYLTHRNTSCFTVTNRTFFALRIYPNWIHLKVKKEHKHTQDAMLTLNIFRCLSIFTGLLIILKNEVFR